MTETVPFEALFAAPLRNGVSYSSAARGSGVRMVNMREIFAYDRIADQECELAPLTDAERATSLLVAGDLLFARQSLTYEGAGKCVLVLPSSVDRTWESHLIRVRLDQERAWPAYYYYFFRSASGRALMEEIIQQVAAAGIRGSDLRRLVVPSLNVDRQRSIADLLAALDDKIATNTDRATVSDAYIAALFERATAGTRAGEQPLLQACEVTFGEPFGGAHFTGRGVGRPLIRIRDLKTFEPQIWTKEVRGAEVVVNPGDIVVGMDAEFRPTPWLGQPGLLNQRVCRVVGRTFGQAYTREALKEPLAEIEGYKSATTVIHLNKSDLVRATVRVAEPTALAAFEARAEPVFAARVATASENRKLAELRDTLLPELMSGRLNVRDAERVVEDVV